MLCFASKERAVALSYDNSCDFCELRTDIVSENRLVLSEETRFIRAGLFLVRQKKAASLPVRGEFEFALSVWTAYHR